MKKLKSLTILFILTTLFMVVGGPLPNVLASPEAVAPDLGSAATFVALASSTLTNTGSGVFIGNVGVSPGTSVSGFPPGTVINGAIHRGDAVAAQAQIDANSAYVNLAGQVCNVHLTGQDLGGMTLTPGVYCFDTSAQLTGNLVLDALGNPNAIWVFQTGSTLTTASASSVAVINGGNALNVFWQVGSSATCGTGTRFTGNILADASITFDTGASLTGRALALNGAVTLDTTGSPFPITIIHPIPPTVRFNKADYSVAENGASATISVTLSAASGLMVSVDYLASDGTAVGGVDYTTPISGTLTFAPGETLKTFEVPILDNSLDQISRTVNLALSNPLNAMLGAPDKATLTIMDDDGLPAVQFSRPTYSVAEDGGSVTITVTLDAPYTLTATINYTSSDGTAIGEVDYTPVSGLLTFALGETTKIIAITITDDSIYEGDKDFQVVLSNPLNAHLGAPNVATITVLEDDPLLRYVYFPVVYRNTSSSR
jgi:hypothetical protein